MVDHKKALLIGINYVGTVNELKGCWADIYAMRDYIVSVGYKPSNIVVMTDEEKNKNTSLNPTLLNIRLAIGKFILAGRAGDTLFFHYSGHGGSLRDRNNDERDGRDECIFPCDDTIMIDDELRSLLCDALLSGVTLRCVLDCCHSGSSLDLPWRYLPSRPDIRENTKECTKDIVAVSGCADPDTSADTYMDGRPSGALTGFLLRVLKNKHPYMRWVDLIQVLQHEIRVGGYSQVPQLSFSNAVSKKKVVDL